MALVVQSIYVEKLPCWKRPLGFELQGGRLTIHCDRNVLDLDLIQVEDTFRDSKKLEFLQHIPQQILGFLMSEELVDEGTVRGLLVMVMEGENRLRIMASGFLTDASLEDQPDKKREHEGVAARYVQMSQGFRFLKEIVVQAMKSRRLLAE